jgi:hypothetical protein
VCRFVLLVLETVIKLYRSRVTGLERRGAEREAGFVEREHTIAESSSQQLISKHCVEATR